MTELFGRPHQKYKCPDYMIDALEALRWVIGFLSDEDDLDPFGPTGESFECSTFKVQVYEWDSETRLEFNFAWRDVRVSWHKYIGREMSINRHTTWDETKKMLAECTKALLEEEA